MTAETTLTMNEIKPKNKVNKRKPWLSIILVGTNGEKRALGKAAETSVQIDQAYQAEHSNEPDLQLH